MSNRLASEVGKLMRADQRFWDTAWGTYKRTAQSFSADTEERKRFERATSVYSPTNLQEAVRIARYVAGHTSRIGDLDEQMEA